MDPTSLSSIGQVLVDIADRLGLIGAVKGKLVRQPDIAAEKLATVLLELEKIYRALDDGITQYLAVSIDVNQPEDLQKDKDTLNALAFGAALNEMNRARTHCSKIWNIYSRYLNSWFDRVLETSEKELMQGLFEEFKDADYKFVRGVENLATRLSRDAQETLLLVNSDMPEAANVNIREGFRAYWPLRQALSDSSNRLRILENDFIEISGAV